MASSKAVKYMLDDHTPTHIPCKFCGYPAKNYKALCAHLKACKKRFQSMIIRFIDEDLWIKGNRIILDIIKEHILDESFDSAYATLDVKKAFFKGIILIGRRYGKNMIIKAEWGALNSFDNVATSQTEIYEV